MRKKIRWLFVGSAGVRAPWGLALYLVFVVLFGATFLAMVQGRRVHLGGADPIGLIKSEFAAFAAVVCATWVMAKLEHRVLVQFGLPALNLRGSLRNLCVGAVWGLLLEGTCIFVLARLHVFSFGAIDLPFVKAATLGFGWLVAAFGIACFEESFFRGYPLFTMARGMKFWPATFLVAGLFASAHLGNLGQTAVGAIGLFVATIFVCLTVRRTGNLWFAVGFHALLDWSEIFLFGVPQGQGASGILRRSEMHGPVWVTGTDGNEGSIVFIVLILVGLVIFHRLYPECRYPTLDLETNKVVR